MTNKGKVLAAIVAVAVGIAGGAAFYFKGGDLMGRMKLLPAYDTSCPAGSGEKMLYTTVSGKSALYGSDFNSFYNALKREVNSNSGKLTCPLKVVMGESGKFGHMIIVGDYSISFTDQGTYIDFKRVTGSNPKYEHVLDLRAGDAMDSAYGSVQVFSRSLDDTYQTYSNASGNISVSRVSPDLY